ncbi:MAG TPA: PLP-dependent transferase, partial [Gammaproteobacteria bacterium]
RVSRQNANADALAGWLCAQPDIAAVHYPGLPGHPGHAVAARQMRGFGGMLSFELAPGAADPVAFQRRLRLVRPAVSLGGVESLISAPVLTSHAKVDPATRAALGIGERLLRLSVGIEAFADLRDDLAAALHG